MQIAWVQVWRREKKKRIGSKGANPKYLKGRGWAWGVVDEWATRKCYTYLIANGEMDPSKQGEYST